MLSHWQITHDHKYTMMGVDCGKWRESVYVCILFVVHCKNGVGSLVVHHPVHVIFGGGARRKQFMTKGVGRWGKVGPLH